MSSPGLFAWSPFSRVPKDLLIPHEMHPPGGGQGNQGINAGGWRENSLQLAAPARHPAARAELTVARAASRLPRARAHTRGPDLRWSGADERDGGKNGPVLSLQDSPLLQLWPATLRLVS